MKSIYPHKMEPEDYPGFSRRYARATTRSDLDNDIQFATLRRFTEENNRLTDINEKLDLYTKQIEMGKIIWPFVSTLYAENFSELIAEIKKRGLYLFDFWGYVPGTNTAGQSWGQYKVPLRPVELMHEQLGPKFLGMDNGEQDGRYIGAYAHLMYPDTINRKKQFINFYDYFEQLTEDMRHHITVLCSLNYGHYFAHKGDHIMLGAETAQALPNNNLWYAYLRGAGKQYGLLWFGNASVWNRFGWKNYTDSGDFGSYDEHSAESGTSLSLLRRLMYTQYMYNCVILGFESGWFYSRELEGDKELGERPEMTPIGEVQHGCVGFAREHGDPGTLCTPTAVVLDFYNGWTYPRHLYTKTVHKAWGNIPYSMGDYQIDSLFSLVYPGYENAGFYHDERGFLTPTPFGDSIDVLFNNARSEILGQYNQIILAGDQKIDAENGDKLERYVSNGGHLIIFAAQLPTDEIPAWMGVSRIGQLRIVSGPTSYKGREYEDPEFEVVELALLADSEVLATAGKVPLIIRSRTGDGYVDVVSSSYGINKKPFLAPCEISNGPDEEIPVYYRYIPSVAAFVGDCLKAQQLLDVGNANLQFTVNWLDATTMTLSIANNGESEESFSIGANYGDIRSIEEWELPPCPADTLGYYPKVSKEKILGSIAKTQCNQIIQPGDFRIFKIHLQDSAYEIKEKAKISDMSKGRTLSFWNTANLRDELLTRERLDQHFDGIKIEARYLLERDPVYLKIEGAWLKRQKIKCTVDFIGLLNFYPKLTLIANIESRRDDSLRIIESVFDKMALIGADQAIFSLHRNAENNYSVAQATVSFIDSFTEIADLAAERGIEVCVVPRPLLATSAPGKSMIPGINTRSVVELVRGIGKKNLTFGLDLSHTIMLEENIDELLAEYSEFISLLMIGVPLRDSYRQYYNVHLPVSGSAWERDIVSALTLAEKKLPNTRIFLNAVYTDWDQVYADICLANTSKIWHK